MFLFLLNNQETFVSSIIFQGNLSVLAVFIWDPFYTLRCEVMIKLKKKKIVEWINNVS